MLITAKLLEQIGLILGFVSGILLIPEIINFLPLAKLEESIEHKLFKLENFTKFPLRFSPPSWRYMFTEEQREAVEPITAIGSFIFSVIWISILITGILFSYYFLIAFTILILIVVVIANMRRNTRLLRQLSYIKVIFLFLSLLFIIMILTPIVSLIRVIMLTLRLIVSKAHKFFSANEVLRKSLTIFAIVAFIISNVLQFLATLL